jgi:glyoxylase-like metal-dependent hydrolase (beta-lactamase superfamily II)
VRIIRLPGIHHDANAVIFAGSDATILVDTGTTWYQMLQIERIAGHIENEHKLERILLTSRRFPFSGAAKHIADANGEIPIHIHSEGVSAMQTGDFFTTWANRYDSDMPSTDCQKVSGGDIFDLGDGNLTAIELSGHSPDGMGYFEPERGVLVTGAVLPRADNPSRWDLPGGCLPDLVSSLKTIHNLAPSSIVPARGPTIRGSNHIDEILTRHLEFFENVVVDGGQTPSSWPRPARTAYFLTPGDPWPLEEKEGLGENK